MYAPRTTCGIHTIRDSGRTLLEAAGAAETSSSGSGTRPAPRRCRRSRLLLRVYPTATSEKVAEVERQYHRLLEAADHDRSQARAGGTEWFLASVRFLDEIANVLGLPVREVVDLGDVD